MALGNSVPTVPIRIFRRLHKETKIYATFGSNYLSRRLDRVDDINFGVWNARNDNTKVGKRQSKFQGPHTSLTTNSCGRIHPNKLS